MITLIPTTKIWKGYNFFKHLMETDRKQFLDTSLVVTSCPMVGQDVTVGGAKSHIHRHSLIFEKSMLKTRPDLVLEVPVATGGGRMA